MADVDDARAVLIAGVYGSGMTSVVEEIADILEGRGVPYGALDLDWLAWFDTGREDAGTEERVFLRNLAAVVGNYLDAGVRYFVLACAVGDESELESLRAALGMPLKVVRLSVPLRGIEERLRPSVTSGRQDDLREAAAWLRTSRGVGIEDVMVQNDGPVREVAEDILRWLGWDQTVDTA